jgi:two-component system phosphate regulon response regulator PhoB
MVVEDEEDVQLLIVHNLRAAGFDVVSCEGLAEARAALSACSPQVIVLDRMLPDGDGLSLCAELRTDGRYDDVGVLVLTARGTEEDRIGGLEAGADDYVVKPFSVRELVARVRGLALAGADRRSARAVGARPDVLRWKNLLVDLLGHEVRVDGAVVHLRPLEFKLLCLLLEEPGRILSREEIVARLWSGATASPRVVDSHVKRLRVRLGPAADVVETVWKAGYRLA